MIIMHLNHELIVFDNSKLCEKWPKEYAAYKCIKCNNIIYVTLYKGKQNGYWMYEGGEDYHGPDRNWNFLKLTCEEEQIKRLLE